MSTLPALTECLPLRPGKFNAPLKNLSLQKTEQTLPENPPSDQDKPLTRKQKLAVEFLVSGQARTQRKAAEMAGYSPATCLCAGNEIFTKPNVRKELQRRRRELFTGIELTSQDIINDLRVIADANIADYIDIDETNGEFKFDLRHTTRDQLSAVRELGYDAVGRPKVILHDAKAAKMDIAKLMGIGIETTHTTQGELTIQALDAMIANSTTNNVTINQQINVSEKDLNKYLPVREVTRTVEQNA